ncbi:MAG: efflux RND transporter periplasmic adaptor subunit [Sphingomicrobium sp.]
MLLGGRARRALAIVAMTVLPLVVQGCSKADETAPQQGSVDARAPRLKVAMVESVDWVDVGGEIATVDQSQVLARISGILTSLSIREGDYVRKGDVIGRIVDSQLGYQAGAYGAQAAAAQAQAVQAQSDLKRVRYLYDNKVYSKARLDQAEAASRAADAQVQAARSQQQAVNAVAGQGIVTAPTTGRVLRSDVPAGSPVAPGTSIATITAGATILRLQLPESLANDVHVGSQVMADLPGSVTTRGSVTTVYPSISAGQIAADVNMPGLSNGLIGRRIPARIERGSRRAIIVPRSFVHTSYGIDTVTLVDQRGQASSIPVQVAPTADPAKIEILSGLKPGDTIAQLAPQ